jgi:serralysin
MALTIQWEEFTAVACPPRRPVRIAILVLACCGPLWLVAAAPGFQLGTRWSTTASGSAGSSGSPVSLTWSIVPDGTPGTGHGNSNLISFLDTKFGAGPGGTDYTARPWYSLFSQSFDHWGQLSGVSYRYEPNDSTVPFDSAPGSTDSRGDIRIAGANIDGPNNTLALTTYPNFADILIDTSDGTFFSGGAPGYLGFRNTLMHEAGHALGLAHVLASTSDFLMEKNISTAFNGPQLDDILGAQSHYGDVFEKSNSGLGNDTAARATSLGAITIGGTKSIGTSPAAIAARPSPANLYVLPTDTDFISIDRNTDTDFYSFNISGAARLSVQLTPRGGSYMQGPEGGSESLFNADAQSDLTLAIYGTNGTTQLALANGSPAGQQETRSNLALPAAGQYYVRVTGTSSIVQLYDLQLLVAAPFLNGDYNHNGKVDAADYTVWRDTSGRTGLGLAADGDGNGMVDSADYSLWKTNFGATGSGAAASGEVPEPATAFLAILGGLLGIRKSRLSWSAWIHRFVPHFLI